MAFLLASLSAQGVDQRSKGMRVLYVDSYHPEYESSRIKNAAAREILTAAGVNLRFLYMDTKRNSSPTFGREAGARAWGEIKSWDPSLLIAADDAAIKYLVEPHLRDAALPIVFIGVNADASVYGLPYSNTTGQVEVDPIDTLLGVLARYTDGRRIGLLTGDTATDRKTVYHYTNSNGIAFHRVRFVDRFDEWKRAFVELQDEVDVLVLRNHGGIAEWDFVEAEVFALENTRVPTGSPVSPMAPVVMIGATKAEAELGRYAASTALKVLGGVSPATIPISENQEAEFYLHAGIAQRLGIVFPPSLLRQAKVVRGP